MGNEYFYNMTPGKRTNILLVDDDADDRYLFASAVAAIGNFLNCECVSGTQEAIYYLQQADPLPDLIFLDMNMPGYDGKRCLRQFKSTQRLQSIPVIIYSTFVSQDDEAEVMKMGAEYVITKPGDFSSLQSAILQSIESLKKAPSE